MVYTHSLQVQVYFGTSQSGHRKSTPFLFLKMTPGDVTALVELGETLYGGADMINLIGNCVMYGLYALSFFTALYMFCSKPLKGPTHRALLALLIIVFFFTHWGLY